MLVYSFTQNIVHKIFDIFRLFSHWLKKLAFFIIQLIFTTIWLIFATIWLIFVTIYGSHGTF